jgi:hypothetical protein
MPAYYKVEATLNSQAVQVGIPSPQTVRVTIPLVGPAGPAGPKGDKGDPGDVAGAVAWDNVTDKPSTFPPEAHTHTADQITDFSTAAAAAALVQSVAGQTGTVTLAVADVSGAVADTDARLSDDRNPTSHASSHLPEGADEIFDQSLNTDDDVAFSSIDFGDDFTIGADGFATIERGEAKIKMEDGLIEGFGISIRDERTVMFNELDPTKQAIIDASTITTDTLRTYSLPDANGTLALTSDIPDPSAATPQALGSASAGTSDDYSRGDHIHAAPALNDLSNVSAATPSDNDVLTFDTATSTWVAEAPAAGGVSAIGASAADVFSVSGSDLVADDGDTIDGADPFIKWDDTAGKLVYANPLSRPEGAFYVGLAPTTTALGTGALNIEQSRSAAAEVASGQNSMAIGRRNRASAQQAIAVGEINSATGINSMCFGSQCTSSGQGSVTIGVAATASAPRAIGIGVVSAIRRAELAVPAFSAIYWGGQTTNDTATILNLDATATNRFTIAANTALAVDILLVARRSDTADKWLVARRFLGIRRDGSNNTSLIGSVQTLGTDQSEGSPSWSFTLTADDTNEALQLEVTGAASETVQWRATAFYRVV